MFSPGFVAKVVAVADPGLRPQLVAHALAEMPAVAATNALAEAIRSSVALRDKGAQAALLAVVAALGTNKFSYLTLEALYRASRAEGHDVVARMLMHLGSADEEAARAERPLRPNERPLTLGERKALARRQDRDVLSLLARDPSPDVVEILLGNPRLTERDVIRIASHRPGLPAAMRVVARHPRWLAAPHVRIALVHNPATDVSLALRLVPTLPRRDIEAIANQGGPHPEIVKQAELVLYLAAADAPAHHLN